MYVKNIFTLKNPPIGGFFMFIFIIYIFSQMIYNFLESKGLGSGLSLACLIRYKTVAYRESDMLPVVLCRYLSLTVSVGGLFAIQQGQPKSNRINDKTISELPDRHSLTVF